MIPLGYPVLLLFLAVILGYPFLIALAGGRVLGLFTGPTLGLVTGSLSQDSTQHDKEVHPHPLLQCNIFTVHFDENPDFLIVQNLLIA
jgi:hypothetical protein